MELNAARARKSDGTSQLVLCLSYVQSATGIQLRRRAVTATPGSARAPTRIVIQYPDARRRRRALSRPSAASATRSRVSADVFRDGHDLLRAVVRYRAPGRAALARGRAAPDRRPDRAASAGRASSRSTRRAAGSTRSRRGRTCSGPGAMSSSASSPAGQHDLAGRAVGGRRCCCEAAAASGHERGGARADRARAADARRSRRSRSRAKHDVVARRRAVRGGRARRRSATARSRSSSRSRSRSTGCGPGSAPGTSCSRARGAGSRASSSSFRGSPSSASTSSTCRRSTRSATPTARAATTRSSPAPGDPGSPWAIGDADRRPRRDPPRPRDDRRTSSALTARGARARDRHRARLRDPVLGRPPVADRAPRVVSPPARRHAQVRREPAQALPGHLQRQLGLARTGAGCGTRCWTSCCTGSTAASRCSGSTTRTPSRSRSGRG